MHGSGHLVTGYPTGQALSLPQSPADCGGGMALLRTLASVLQLIWAFWKLHWAP